MSIRFLIQEHKNQKMKSESTINTEDVAAKLHIASLENKIKQLEQELESAKKDQARYLKLTETGNFCPTKYSGLWGLHMSGRPYTKAELDAPIDAAIAAKESSK